MNYYIKNLDKKSRQIISCLALELEGGAISTDSFDESMLNTKEIISLRRGKYIDFIDEATKDRLQKVQVSVPLPENNEASSGGSYELPQRESKVKIRQVVQKLQEALNELHTLFSESETPSNAELAPEDKSLQSGQANDDNPLPSIPPPGMQPAPEVQAFLKKTYPQKVAYLKTTDDLNIVSQIVMFETVANIKDLARKRLQQIRMGHANVTNAR